MIRIKFLIFLVAASQLSAQYTIRSSGSAVPDQIDPPTRVETELTLLDVMIDATEEYLRQQKELRKMIVDYLDVQSRYLKDTSDRGLSFRMVVKAHEVLAAIQELQLNQAFDAEFLNDLTFFSNIAEGQRED